jgi:lipopolysaccharide export system protein LptA
VSGQMTQRTQSYAVALAALAAVALAVCMLHRNMRGDAGMGGGRLGVASNDESRGNAVANRDATTGDLRLKPIVPTTPGIDISADLSQEWTDGAIAVSILRGRCVVRQDATRLSADTVVVWRRTDAHVFGAGDRMVVYLEGNARIERPGSTLRDAFLLWELSTKDGVRFAVRRPMRGPSGKGDPLYLRADSRWKKSIETGRGLQPTQLVLKEQTEDLGPQLLSLRRKPNPKGIRRVRIFPRSAVSFSVQSFQSKLTTPPEQVWVLTGGINMIIEGGGRLGLVDLSADRMVVWTRTSRNGDFQADTVQSEDTPFEVYLEGNIVVLQGRNKIRAARAAYDARENRGLIFDAELKAFIPALKDTVRVRAERIRQLSRNSFHASNAWTSTSRFGKPGYRIQATDVFLENRQRQPWFGAPDIDPETGEPETEVRWLTSINNTLFVEDVPLMYVPYLSAPAEDPHIPLRRLSFGNDRIFGFKARSAWDMFGLLGMEKPKGVTWELLADYLSDRGPAVGTAGSYKGRDLLGLPGLYSGSSLNYTIYDTGTDNLGADRRSLVPAKTERYMMQFRHRHELPFGWTVLGEFGLLSDRNFLESYYERDFDRQKDVETLLYAKQQYDNKALTLLVRPQLNNFETSTAWLPRGDLYVLSEPLFDGHLTWSSHTSAGFANLHVGDNPTDPSDIYVPLPYVVNASGAVLMSRHELNAPFSLGPIRVVPYVRGEAAFWNEGFQNETIDRFVGTGGVRGSLMFWRAFPNVYSELFNLNGLAHKHTLEADFSVTDSSRSLSQIPQYNEFDENSQERFRNRFIINTFNGVLPPQFEPRFYAIRSGAGQYVTVPYHELVDDQQVLRLAWRHQLQTKVGPPERLRIKDWMTLDLEASYFPKPDRDDFGESFGLLGAFYRWNLSDQTTLLVSAQGDLFDNAAQIFNVGYILGRTTRGSLYIGLRELRGASLDSQIVTLGASYTMSPKWITTLSTGFDIAEARNVGQSLTITRVGADFLVHVGANFDASKNNAGFTVAVEPRLGALKTRMTQLGSLLQPR